MNSWLSRALEESRARGYLGPSAIEPHVAHAEGFARCWESIHDTPPLTFVDLGSGGGLPALVLLELWRCQAVLTDSMVKRAAFLEEVLAWDDSPAGATVITGRVEDIARYPALEESVELVTARSFGPPSVTAECGVRFLKVGGVMIVSEPPDDAVVGRWDTEGLTRLGLRNDGRVRHGAAFQVLTKVRQTPSEYPRAIGIPRKKPIF